MFFEELFIELQLDLRFKCVKLTFCRNGTNECTGISHKLLQQTANVLWNGLGRVHSTPYTSKSLLWCVPFVRSPNI